MAQNDEDVEEKVKSLVGSILAYPTFRETIGNIFSPESTSASTNQELAAASSSANCSSHSRPASSSDPGPSCSSAFARPQYLTAAQEFPAKFRRGGSTQRHNFQRGFNHTSPRRRGRRQAPYICGSSSSHPPQAQ
eukprot:Seg2210.5 transcript_id=Seg2210.5/GoldUCD/mRNA.D3Y31 product="hypothetical protein" protein_id=Seg2210.5/GoldUCD/D3Y31